MRFGHRNQPPSLADRGHNASKSGHPGTRSVRISARDVLWLVLAGFFLAGYVTTVIAGLRLAAEGGSYLALLSVPLGGVGAWWLVVGAWRRTAFARRRRSSRFRGADLSDDES